MNVIISGKVTKGKGKGNKLGFPTVNIELKKKIESGVYAGFVETGGKKYKAGVFINKKGNLLEAYLIDFAGNLYGEEIETEIGEKIREVMKFESDEELREQIEKDINIISNY